MFVTAEMLRETGADLEQIEIFTREWPQGVEITEASLLRAIELHLLMKWFVVDFLPTNIQDKLNREDSKLYWEYKHEELVLEGQILGQRYLLWEKYNGQRVTNILRLLDQAEFRAL